MIRIAAVLAQVHGIGPADLDDWIARGWVRPHGEPPDWTLPEHEVARLRLVRDLRRDAGIAEDTLPVVLSLLDQIADLRHALSLVSDALDELPPDTRAAVAGRLRALLYTRGRHA